MTDDVGCGDVDDVRLELGKIAADAAGQAKAKLIFRTAGQGDRRDWDQLAGRVERRSVGHRRINAYRHTLPLQIADQAVQRLVGPVADIIVIARKQGDAKVAGLHGGGA